MRVCVQECVSSSVCVRHNQCHETYIYEWSELYWGHLARDVLILKYRAHIFRQSPNKLAAVVLCTSFFAKETLFLNLFLLIQPQPN